MGASVKLRKVQVELRSRKRVTIPAWALDSDRDGPCLLLTAAQHGNEVQGAEAIRRFVDLAHAKIKRGSVIAVPMVNLPAIRERRPHIRMKPEQPYKDSRGHNMNGLWPGTRADNNTARIAAAIHRTFGDRGTHVFDLHCWEKNRAPALLIRDEPELRELAIALGHRFVRISAPLDRTLAGLYCSTGRIGLTYEFSGQYVVCEEQVQHGLSLIVNLAKAIGILPGAPRPVHSPVLFSDRSEQVNVTAPCSGLFVGTGLRLCDPVTKDTTLGWILSDRDLVRHEIRTPNDGFLHAYGASRANCDVALPGHHPYVTAGERLACVQKGKPSE